MLTAALTGPLAAAFAGLTGLTGLTGITALAALPVSLLHSLAAHHDEIADPDFLEWLQIQLNHLIQWGPWPVILAVGALTIALPVAIIAFYLYQQRRR